MKKFTLIFIVLLAMVGFTRAQVVENFESIKMNLMAGGADDLSSFTVVANPDTAGPANINKSALVCKFLRDMNGVAWGGFYAPLTTPIDMTASKYVHVKVWKPRISPVHCKLEDGPTPTELQPINPQTVINGWEELVFDFSAPAIAGLYNKLTFMPDFEDPLTLTEDITIYFDDFYVNNDPAVGSAPIQVIENYEHIPLNYMLGGAEDLSSMTQIPNPDPTGINVSSNVIQFIRDKDGVPWGGFWSTTQVDVTTNKYVHVKVWKPRISPVKFKLQDGAAGTKEVASMNPQTLTNTWEDMVFDFSTVTGTYPIIAFMPDFEDPLTLTNDITIYFDDIVINNDPNPVVPVTQVINVDMHGSGLTLGQQVFISGDFGGDYGTWAEPGSKPGNEMFDTDGDSIYTININVVAATYHFKFFKGTTWANGDNGPGDRALPILGDLNVTYKWGVKSPVVTINVDMHGSHLLADQKVYLAGTFGGMYGTWNEPGTNLNCMLSDIDGDSIYSITLTYLTQPGSYEFKFFKGETWAGGEWASTNNRVFEVKGDTVADFVWGTQDGLSENPLANKVSAYPVPFSNTLNINTLVDVKTVVIT